MKGKNKCRILKQIRQKIADENDIPYVTRECTYQGECRGTCPKCEAELRYLEQELEKRRRLGKSVAVAAVAAGLSMTLAACQPKPAGSGTASGSAGGETVRPQSVQTVQPDPDQVPGRIEKDPNLTEPACVPPGSEPAAEDMTTAGVPEPLEGEPEYIPPEETDLLAGETGPFVELEGNVIVLPETETDVPEELAGDIDVIPDTEPETIVETADTSDQGGANHG